MKPENTVDFQIRWAWSKISRMYNAEASKFGGTMSAGYILLNIDKEGTPSTKLGPKMGMESRSLTRTLRKMEEDGLIKRVQDRSDKRMVLVHLTEEGIELRNTSREFVLQFNSAIHDEINDDELATFFKVMEKINLMLDRNKVFSENKELK